MIEHEQEKYGWEFLFIGANIDAIGAASSIGIRANRAVNYIADSEGTERVYKSVGRAMCCMSMRPEAFSMDDSWREEIDEDYNRRSGKSKKSQQ